MPKFFVSKSQIANGAITVTGEDVLHITKVLRYGPGDTLLLCDGVGMDYEVQIVSLEKKTIDCVICSQHPCAAEPPVSVTLFQGLPKASKMDYIIQKTVELGVAKIIPVETKFCVAKAKDGKRERYQKIALEAAKQCGRGVIPPVEEAVPFTAALDALSKLETKIMAYEGEREGKLKTVLKGPSKEIGILVGPEGGFASEEAEAARKAGAKLVTLGPRILRTETAGAALLAAVMYEWGDW